MDCIEEMKQVPVPNMMQQLGQLSFITIPLITLFLFAMAVVSKGGLFWMLFTVMLIFSIRSIIRKIKGNNLSDKIQQNVNKYKAFYEKTVFEAKMQYGKNKEVTDTLLLLQHEIEHIDQNRKKTIRNNTIVWSIIITVVLLSGTSVIAYLNKSLNTPERISQRIENRISIGNINGAIEIYNTTQFCDSTASVQRLRITNGIIKQGSINEAESFFFTECIGKEGDINCAVSIVNYYINNNQRVSARSFVGKCNSLSNPNDLKVLNNLIKK